MEPEAAKPTPRSSRVMAICLVVLGLIIVIALLLPVVVDSTRCPVTGKALTEAMAFTCAVEHYRIEYGNYPGQNSTNADHLYSGAECRMLLATLMGSNLVWDGKPSNPRGIAFLSVDTHSIVTANITGTAQAGEFADPWGNRYEVVADWTGDDKIDAPLADGEGVQTRGVAVWSYGPNAKPVANPKDKTHLRSWR